MCPEERLSLAVCKYVNLTETETNRDVILPSLDKHCVYPQVNII